jgi:ketosteroid isomerase-like protein
MKKNLFLFIIAVIFMTACQQTPEQVSVNIEAEKAAIEDMLEDFLNGIKAQDVDTMASFILEDALVCGTDPSEFWNKEEIVDLWKQMLTESPIEFKYIGDKAIKVAPDGNSAIAVDQYYIPIYSPNIPWRNVYSLTKVEDKWMISFWSIALIPKNEDLEAINKALTVKEPIQ